MRRSIRSSLPAVLLVALLVVLVAVRLPAALAQRGGDYAMFDPIVDVYHLITTHFFKDIDDAESKKMQEGAIRGMLEALDDPYTEFIPNDAIADFDKEIRGEYAGIGAQVDTRDNWLLIVSPMEDTPAYRAGVEADDLVVAVDGQTTYNVPVDTIIDRLTGKAGTPVTITIERSGTDQDLPPGAKPPSVPGALGEAPGPKPGSTRFDLTLTREKIVASTVKGVHRVGDKWDYWIDPVKKLGYIRVTQFTAGTIPELEAASRQLVDGGLKGLILDLRFNGGGSLLAAIQMADLFLSEGLIVTTKGRATQEERVYAKAEGTLPDFPMIVMLNESSASASEVVSGALSDNKRAVILGSRSFGKGIVQSMYRLPSGAGQLKVTEQYYYLPSGRCIQRTDEASDWGVDPTPGFYVPMNTEQYREMFKIRRQDEVIRNGKPPHTDDAHWADPRWILDHLKDIQLSAAVDALAKRLEKGEWVPTGGDMPKATLELAELKREQRRYELLLREVARSERRINTLSSATGEKPHEPKDLFPGAEDLTGGKVQVYDSHGKAIATLSITGPDLERWLVGAPVEPESAAAGAKPAEPAPAAGP